MIGSSYATTVGGGARGSGPAATLEAFTDGSGGTATLAGAVVRRASTRGSPSASRAHRRSRSVAGWSRRVANGTPLDQVFALKALPRPTPRFPGPDSAPGRREGGRHTRAVSWPRPNSRTAGPNRHRRPCTKSRGRPRPAPPRHTTTGTPRRPRTRLGGAGDGRVQLASGTERRRAATVRNTESIREMLRGSSRQEVKGIIQAGRALLEGRLRTLNGAPRVKATRRLSMMSMTSASRQADEASATVTHRDAPSPSRRRAPICGRHRAGSRDLWPGVRRHARHCHFSRRSRCALGRAETASPRDGGATRDEGINSRAEPSDPTPGRTAPTARPVPAPVRPGIRARVPA